MSIITMPRLSDSMEQGLIVSWLKHDSEPVQKGEDLLEIETDKATLVHPSEASGVLHILIDAGTTVTVGTTIAELRAPEGATRADRILPTAASRPVAAPQPASPPSPAGDLRPTPLARRTARAHGVSLAAIPGTGPLGRITRTDVLTHAGIAQPQAAPAPVPRRPQPTPATAPDTKGEVEMLKPTRLQELVARRMTEAKATIPHFQVQAEVPIDAAIALRTQINALDEHPVSLNDLIIKAAALALREHPLANGSFRDGGFELHPRINVGLAVAAESALMVPTIFDADQKSLGTIAADSATLAARVRDGSITPPELAGATFTVSNLGMYGMSAITPVINPPQSAILGVGGLRPTLAKQDQEIIERTLMTLTLSADHRILYGAEAARFLAKISALLQQPLSLVR